LSFQAFCGMTVLAAVSWFITSGTSPMVSAPTIFCISGANGTRVRSTLLPLAFSYPATTARTPRREFTRALLREFGVHTDPYASLSLHRRDQGRRLRSRRVYSL